MSTYSKSAVTIRVEPAGRRIPASRRPGERPALVLVGVDADPEDVLRATAKIVSRRYAVRCRF